MALEVVNSSLGGLATDFAVSIFERFTWLAGLVRAVGIFVVIYIIYLIIKAVRDIKMRSRIARIDKKVGAIEKKLDKVLNRGVDNKRSKSSKKKKN